jgi:hypothetical protein
MITRRSMVLALGVAALTTGAVALTHRLAQAAQNQVVVQRFLLGYTDKRGRFIPTAGRNATNVDRNAIAMFVFSGAVQAGPNLHASLPLTLAEQAELQERIQQDPDYDPTRDGYEPGVIPRKKSEDPSAYFVATGSVNVFSMAIASQSGGGSQSAPGQFFKFLKPGTIRPSPNRVMFNPRYTAATFNKPGEIDYNPEALEANTQYQVTVDGGPNPANLYNTVRNLSDEVLGARFTTSFTTTSRYVQDYNRPEYRSTSPGDQATNVAYDADIDIEFDEPMDIGSFVTPRFQGDDQWTINVRYSANVQLNGSLAGRNVLGTMRIKPQTGGNVVQFRPLQGFGQGPYEVETVVTNGVTDLSGNNIIRQFQFTFRTEYNPNAESFSSIDEVFDSTTKRDASFTPSGDFLAAGWNATGARGLLSTSVQETYFEAYGPNAPTAQGTGVNIWYHSPVRAQMLFPASVMGGRARTLSGAWWVKGVQNGRSYPATSIQLGHANDAVDTGGFPTGGPSNLNFGDTPVQVVSGTTYSTSAALQSNEYVKLPDFLRTFNYDGSSGMILDISHNGDPAANGAWERWRIDGSYPVNCSSIAIGTATQVNGWLYSTRFDFLSPGAEAQSLFYDVGRSNARLLPQQIVPQTQPQGTSVVFLWQGAKEDAINPTVPDMSTLTSWVPDIRQLTNYRYVRFRVTLVNNTAARTAPTVDTLTIPYVFK